MRQKINIRKRNQRAGCNRRAPSTIFHVPQCESGGIGRRARLRIWYRKVWGFESPLSHQNERPRLPKSKVWVLRVRKDKSKFEYHSHRSGTMPKTVAARDSKPDSAR